MNTTILLGLLCLPGLNSTAPSAGDHALETNALRKPTLHTGGNCVIRNVTIHSAVGPETRGDVYVRDGDIAAIGTSLEVPAGIRAIDGSDKHLAPGVIDNHSHMAVDGSVNEGSLSITCEVDISDVLDPTDETIYRALAGGVTAARILHGSATAIGGRHEVIKLKWDRRPEELKFPGAKEGVKFALGENPKQSNGGGGTRFPDSRMGVEALYYRAFTRAREYAQEWKAFEALQAAGKDPMPPRRDVRLDALRGILEGTIDVHSHCYRADEILMLLRVADSYGFHIKTLQHVLEGYKVAFEMAAAGVGGSTFGDWWAYKIEAYDAIPQNAALLDAAGVVTSVNSDDAEMGRRLYGEAAKSIRYGGMDPVRALDLVTLNSAKQLGIDGRTGSIEVGKDADLVLLNGEPLSSLARAGLPFAIESSDSENPRNVVFHAAMAAAYGLPHDEAVRAVTLYAARTLGLDKELGSLTVGKRGDVVVTEGDLLDIRAKVDMVFIDGVQQSVKNRQTELYERYKARLERKRAKK
ncbi:MAG: amidohydrolase family protein [Planctomycetota bacterium]